MAPTSTRAPRAADLGEPTTLLLVRHGRTEFTEQRRLSGAGGATDPGLSPAGQDDARSVSQILGRLGGPSSLLPEVPRPNAIVASPLLRTRQTATVIGAELGLDVAVDEGWIEAGFGDWDGLTLAEVFAGWPVELGGWRGSLTEIPPGGGESLEQLVARVRAARQRTIEAFRGQCVVIVTHVTPVRAVVQEALDAGPVALWRLAVAPCSVTVVRSWSDGGAEVLVANANWHGAPL